MLSAYYFFKALELCNGEAQITSIGALPECAPTRRNMEESGMLEISSKSWLLDNRSRSKYGDGAVTHGAG